MKLAVWVVSGLLALGFLGTGAMKVFPPEADVAALAEGVPVVLMRIAGMAEHVDREIDGQVDVPRLYLRGILGVGLARQGVVVEETPFGAGQQRRAHGQEPAKGHAYQESSGCGHDQNAALAANTRCRPSAPRATSTRSGVCTGP